MGSEMCIRDRYYYEVRLPLESRGVVSPDTRQIADRTSSFYTLATLDTVDRRNVLHYRLDISNEFLLSCPTYTKEKVGRFDSRNQAWVKLSLISHLMLGVLKTKSQLFGL